MPCLLPCVSQKGFPSSEQEDNLEGPIQRVIFISLTGIGVLGNIILFVRHVYTFIMSCENKNIDVILIHLAFVNTIIIYCIGVRDIATIFYIRNFLGDVGCKTIIYLERVARGLSICTTCLLSMVQAVTISPRTTLWRKLKQHILAFLFLFWIFNSLISSNLLHYITAGSSMNRSEIGMFTGYCYMLPSKPTVKWLFLSFMALRDVIFRVSWDGAVGHWLYIYTITMSASSIFTAPGRQIILGQKSELPRGFSHSWHVSFSLIGQI